MTVITYSVTLNILLSLYVCDPAQLESAANVCLYAKMQYTVTTANT